MRLRNLLTAGLLGLALCSTALSPVQAQTLRVLKGSESAPLNVPMNRAVVVESDTPFAELSIANPGIADISTLSDRSIYVLGKTPGRTTLTSLRWYPSSSAKAISTARIPSMPSTWMSAGFGLKVRTLSLTRSLCPARRLPCPGGGAAASDEHCPASHQVSGSAPWPRKRGYDAAGVARGHITGGAPPGSKRGPGPRSPARVTDLASHECGRQSRFVGTTPTHEEPQ